MDLATVQWLGVLVCTIVVFTSGMLWFSQRAFFPVWWRAMGRTDADVPGGANMPLVFGLTLVGMVLQATAVALVLGLVRDAGFGDLDQLTGLLVGIVLGIAVAAASLSHRLFAGHGVRVWALEVGNDLLNFALMGLILSFWY